MDKYTQLFLAAQTALLGEVISSLRGLAVDWDNNIVCLYFYHDGEISDEIEEILQEISMQIIADFNEAKLNENFIRLDCPTPLPSHTHWVYRRKEVSCYVPNKSIVTIPRQELEKLMGQFAGSGQEVDKRMPGEIGYKEMIDFGHQIGKYLYKSDTEEVKSISTTTGIIHYYGDRGAHIIPAKPKDFDSELSFKSKDAHQKLEKITQFVLSTEHFPSLRGLAVDWQDNVIILYFYNDGEITEELENDYCCVGSEVIAHYDNTVIEERIFRKDYPSPLPDFMHWAYKKNDTESDS